ncbi:MAG: tetratricopeptide repeat protein [Spirochaetaceae bacterium]|nr:MAG: tetratricopeptide repeat protein [Spirochaetaceae bacterium]
MSYQEYQQLLTQRKYLEAARFAEKQVEEQAGADRDSGEFWLTQQARALNRAGEYAAALVAGRRALNLAPENAFAVAATADALFGLQRREEALGHYLELLRSPRLLQQGRKGVLECLSGLKRWDEILECLSGWNLPEEQSLPWRVKALSALGRSEEALESCRRWLELQPHYPPALWEASELEVRLNGLEAAVEKAGRLARIPSLPQVYREIYASLCRRAGRHEEAVKAYETIGAQGEQSRIQKKKAFTLAKSGREGEALPLLEELLKNEPADKYLHSSYAAACRRIGDLERAINFYNKLLTLHPEQRSLYGRIKGLMRKLEEQG